MTLAILASRAAKWYQYDMLGREEDFAAERRRMVQQQIEGRGITDAAVLAAMGKVPRHCFIEDPYGEYAYGDTPLPIPARQTISQPYVVALMISSLALTAQDRVLEVGTGSGYAAALLGEMVQEVITIERHKRLVEYAQERLAMLGYDNVRVVHGDGTLGCPEHAPYDGIVVAAGGPEVPQSLRQQLKIGGRLVIPIGGKRRRQRLVRVTRIKKTEFRQDELGPVAFVPLIGAEGWNK
jgi:protein-L-isoaspartate(D-aspartate) O-methyltransferase